MDAMVGMKVEACDRYFGNAICRNQVAFTLAITYAMDIMLFFLNTFPWWII